MLQLRDGKNTVLEQFFHSLGKVAVLGQNIWNTFGDHPQTSINPASQPVMADLGTEAQVPALLSSVAGHDLQCPVSDGCSVLFNKISGKLGEKPGL